MEATQGIVSQQAQVNPAQQNQSAVSNLQAAQGTATQLQNPVQRQIQQNELITPSANAETASTYAEQIQICRNITVNRSNCTRTTSTTYC